MKTATRSRLRGPAATAAALLFFFIPGALRADHWRGIEIGVTGPDGRQVQGELISVKPDALVLLVAGTKDESVPIAGIRRLRVLRPPRALTGLGGGLLAGAVAGAIWGLINSDEEYGAGFMVFVGAIYLSAPGALLGLTAGFGAGLDEWIEFGALSEPEKQLVLAKLDRRARVSGTFASRFAAGTAGRAGMALAYLHTRRNRIRLSWTPGYRIGGSSYEFFDESASFRFLDDLPPGEAGPYPWTRYTDVDRPRGSLGRLNAAYALSPSLAAEIEIFLSNPRHDRRWGGLRFTSSLDGLTYEDYFGSDETVKSVSLLAGLVFRPVRPAFLHPHSVEFSAAVGPARIVWEGSDRIGFPGDYRWTDRHRSVAWTARLRASYAYHFGRSFAMGIFAEYRWLEAVIPAYIRTETLIFYQPSYLGSSLTRTTEVGFPARTLDLGGPAIGLTFGLGF